MHVFISGGCKNGKSFFAQEEARRQAEAAGLPLYYVATMIPHDEEDRARIERHMAERDGWGFETLEQGTRICDALKKANPTGVFLLDSVTALLSNEMFDSKGTVDLSAPQRVREELLTFAGLAGSVIFVSDFIYSDALKYDALTEGYRRGLADIDRALAEVCDRVVEVAYGSRYEYKEVQG